MKVIEVRNASQGRSGGPTSWAPRAKCLLFAVIAAAGSGSGLAAAATARGSSEAARRIAPTIVLPARVVAFKSAVIMTKVAGYVQSISVDKGDRVKAGGLIAQLEVPELDADRLQYAAEVDVARRNYLRTQRAIKVAPDLVTPQTLDIQQGRLEVAEAKLERVEALLQYARVTAPFSGVITARFVDPGAFVPVPSSASQKSAAIVTLMSLSRIRVQIPVPARDADLIRPGCRAIISATGLPGRNFPASVTRVSYALAPQTQTMLAEIDMRNPGELLLPGMYVTVRLWPLAAPEAYVAPVNP